MKYELNFNTFQATHIPKIGAEINYHYDDGYSHGKVFDSRILDNGDLEIWLGEIIIPSKYYEMVSLNFYYNGALNLEMQQSIPAEYQELSWWPASRISYDIDPYKKLQREVTLTECQNYIRKYNEGFNCGVRYGDTIK